uniref:Serine/threonine-protein kinase RIO3 n=1 Tax=Steinernema glaseri TaxID=37863 RepID=A0A1I7ZCC3_9BILA
MSSNPWNTKPGPVWGGVGDQVSRQPRSLMDIMSEELAEELDKVCPISELAAATEDFAHELMVDANGESFVIPDCSNDEEIARQLQRDFDHEHEFANTIDAARAGARARARNSSSSSDGMTIKNLLNCNFEVSIPHRHYRDVPGDVSEESDVDDDEEFREWATHLLYAKRDRDEFPACGYVRDHGGKMITKHDKDLAGERNTNKAMQLPIDFPTGDFVGSKLTDKVYNSLRSYSKSDQKRHVRVKDKAEKATHESSMDAMTRLIIFKWINNADFDAAEGIIATGKDKAEKATHESSMDAMTRLIIFKWINNADFDAAEGIIATGKESAVLHGVKRPISEGGSSTDGEEHFAIKVYKTTLKEFKNRSEYVKDDFRFKNPRKVLRVWAEKEYMNLHRLKRKGLPCPEPIHIKKHVMLMSLIGDKTGKPSPKLKNIEWVDETQMCEAFAQVKSIMHRMFNDCDLVHGDLSEFNLLYKDDTVYVIDVSQAMDISHPRALHYLVRDIDNVVDFFQRIGTPTLPSACDIFNEITGLHMDHEKNLMVQVENFETDNRCVQLRNDKANPADCELRHYNTERNTRQMSRDFN